MQRMHAKNAYHERTFSREVICSLATNLRPRTPHKDHPPVKPANVAIMPPKPTTRSRDASYEIAVEDDGVRRVVFSVMSADEIRARAACEVTSVDLFSGGNPVEGGLYDTRMGVVEYGQRCATCHHNNKQCPGHPGYIELAVPVFNSLFVEYTTKILRCVCFTCTRACLPESYSPLSCPGEAALTHAMDQAARVKDKCALCGAARPAGVTWNKQSLSTFTYLVRSEDNAQKELTSQQAYDILCRIPDRECRLLGLVPARTRPEALMFKALPVRPVAVRPPHRSGSQRRDDDITHKLSDVVKNNRRVRAKLDANADPADIVSQVDLLQLDVMQLIENSGSGGAQARMKATNRQLKSIASRLKGKEGRVRNNLMGKRVDFSARSVISAEPNISVDEVGVPVRIAMTLTFPEIVHAGNIERLRRMVSNGPQVYPGARMFRRDGITFSLERPEPRVRTELRVGDVVERHLVDGDVVLFNRQPSLHRMSMMCHRVRVMPHDTLRLNVLVTEAYNADFDGDECNVHVPQCAATAIEIDRLASVKNQIVSPRHHRPIIGVVQDVALGVFLLTQDGVEVDLNTAANICARCSDVMPTKAMTGKQLFSAILPSTLHCEMTGGAVISHGDLVAGSIGKAQYQQEGCGILHSVFAEDGPDAAVRLLDNTQSMTCDWLMRNGHSMGARDIVVPARVQNETERFSDDARDRVNAILAKVHAGTIVNESSEPDIAALEHAIIGELTGARDEVRRLVVADGDATGSRLLSMVRAKSKGNEQYVVQMAGILGQNLIDGGRMPPTLGDRTLPHFHRHDIGADARGFISSSFREGLSPHEFFFHAMAGREGLIDTAVKTADCGYLQRRFVKALKDPQVASDGSVRDAAHNVVSFRYGGDGMDACAIQTQRVPTFGGNLEWMATEFLVCREDDTEFLRALVPPAFGNWKKVDDDGLARLRANFRVLVDDKRFLARVMDRDGASLGEGNVAHAIAFARIVQKWGRAHNPREAVSDLDVLAALDVQDRMVADLFPDDEVATRKNARGCHRIVGATLVRAHLNPKRMIRSGITQSALADIDAAIRHRYYAGLVSPSKMVGIIAAQSIAEPSTQMTLNSFAYDTPLLLDVGGRLVREDIGAFVDAQINATPEKDVEDHPNDTVLAWMRDGLRVRVPSCDENGKVTWRLVEAVTRHPVVNEDGSNTLLKVRLRTGREIVATKAKSFLKRIDNKILPVNGSDLVVGDYLPVSAGLTVPEECRIMHLELDQYLSRDEWLYETEVVKAMDFYAADSYQWWSRGLGTAFRLPYRRSDTVLAAFVGVPSRAAQRVDKVNAGCVYPIRATHASAHIPERIPLDRDFGWFVGAYLAEGCCTSHHLLVANLDDDFNRRVDAFFKKYSINYHIDEGVLPMGHTKNLRAHSLVLTRLFTEMFRTGAANKRIPTELLGAPKEFLTGLVEGYFDGDGAMQSKSARASAYSARKRLLEDLRQILARFDIQSSISRMSEKTFEDNKAKWVTTTRGYTLSLGAAEAMQFHTIFTLTIRSKEECKSSWTSKLLFAQHDVIPDVVTKTWGTKTLKRCELPELQEQLKDQADRAVLTHLIHEEDIFYDQIMSIEEVANTGPWVYDLTVEGTRTFTSFNGIVNFDTFHQTGAANKASVPRVKEFVAVTRNPKKTVYSVRMLPGMDASAEFAGTVRDQLLCTHVRDLVSKTQMVCESGARVSDMDTRLHALEEIFGDGSDTGAADGAGNGDDAGAGDAVGSDTQLRFVLRIVLDRNRMVEHAVSTLDVHTAIFAGVHGKVVAADDAAEQLVVRVTPHVHLAENHDLVAELREMESRILDTRIKGVAGVMGCDVVPPKAEGERVYDATVADYVPRQIYTLEAVAGADASADDLLNIADIPGVDIMDTYGDNLWHALELFGIEAARTLLLKELQGAYAQDNTYTDFRHIELLVDFITRRGVLTAITRHGVGATDAGPLSKCSFEQTVQKIVQAGMFGETDRMTGVSANVMMGQTTPCGTGNSRILWDASDATDLPDGDTLELDTRGMGARVFKVDAIAEYTPYVAANEAIPAIAPGFVKAVELLVSSATMVDALTVQTREQSRPLLRT
jgi:DNA-directed RNA polymerase beta' subunit/intein/homing endonuclease